MTSKTDKRSSLGHVMHYIDSKAEFGKTIPVAKAKRAAQYAFNAGRESVVENIPELKWRKAKGDFLEAYALGAYYLIKLKHIEFYVAYNYNFIAKHLSLSEAKHAANEHYKELIKQALGL